MSITSRPRYLREHRANAGIVLPQFLLHAALTPLITSLGKGTYGRDFQEEALYANLSQDLTDSCFHALQHRPPAIALQFPVTREQLPMITIMRETQNHKASPLGDFTGAVEDDIATTETETILTPSGGALGGETEFTLPCSGELYSSSVEVVVRQGTTDTDLDRFNGDFTVDSATKKITLATGLTAGDILVVTRFATKGLRGGITFGSVFDFTYVIFITTENPLLTSFLEGLVWRELLARHDDFFAYGVGDIDVGFRSGSLWEQVYPSIAHRSEVVVQGMMTWIGFKRQETESISGFTATFTDDDANELVVDNAVYAWDTPVPIGCDSED